MDLHYTRIWCGPALCTYMYMSIYVHVCTYTCTRFGMGLHYTYMYMSVHGLVWACTIHVHGLVWACTIHVHVHGLVWACTIHVLHVHGLVWASLYTYIQRCVSAYQPHLGTHTDTFYSLSSFFFPSVPSNHLVSFFTDSITLRIPPWWSNSPRTSLDKDWQTLRSTISG